MYFNLLERFMEDTLYLEEFINGLWYILFYGEKNQMTKECFYIRSIAGTFILWTFEKNWKWFDD